ncbi:hypothetical protein KKP06_08130, partial [Ralstonia pickettii]|uniref:hypothetical protein n=1 Tax=Ralstonia pickettii TaxID=329 RepID=UPI001BE424F5
HETARFCIKRTTAAKLLNFQVTDLKRKFRRNRQILREKDDYPYLGRVGAGVVAASCRQAYLRTIAPRSSQTFAYLTVSATA